MPSKKGLRLGKYRHAKSGKDYWVHGVGKHSETLEELVVYQPLYPSETIFWLRPKKMFEELVEIRGERVPRFAYIGSMPEKRVVAAVGIVIIQKGKVLLGKRTTGPFAGLWGVPAGKIEFGENIYAAAAREVREETGLKLDPAKLKIISTTDFIDPRGDWHLIDIDLACTEVRGEPKLLEPDKCAGWQWWNLQKLPPKKELHQPTVTAIRAYLERKK